MSVRGQMVSIFDVKILRVTGGYHGSPCNSSILNETGVMLLAQREQKIEENFQACKESAVTIDYGFSEAPE